ncbi:hypothetical protein BGZ96_008829 [Linnemannia gamsii]|uniref:N-acetyltransferase domain-containing protein n=1 Tax=Linnemannia gamsii TaxID=64522 RepID=A0ABQ7JY74_9FUNG|nr:hypothetical protein BGZ96_008829 [Linnemannia gamsii]
MDQSVNLEYPESEAASLKNLVFRQDAAPDLFLGCYLRKEEVQIDSPIPNPNPNNPNSGNTSSSSLELVGYIVSTLVSGDHLTHSSMSSHNPSGDAVCIHSVCVSTAFQRRGVATRMLKEYLQHLQRLNNNMNASTSMNKLKRVLLIAHEHTIGLYAGVGFVLIGQSSVEHGPDPWFEMVYTLDH